MCVKDTARAARAVLTKENWPMRGLVSWTTSFLSLHPVPALFPYIPSGASNSMGSICS